MILNAIATHPTGTEHLLMVATDGVYFSEPHPSLDISPKELGKWDYSEKENLTLFMPGLYWDDTTRQRLAKGLSPKLKSRGVSAGDLANRITELDIAFKEFSGDNWPRLEIPINFQMVTCVQALARKKWENAAILIHGDKKSISANPTSKRFPMPQWTGSYWVTPPYPMGDKLDCTPYDKTFGKPEVLGDSPDGPLEKILYEMIAPGDD